MRTIVGSVVVVACALAAISCSKQPEKAKTIPITTSSEDARIAYVKARDLANKLRGTEAIPFLDEALSKDPNFALAHLLRAQNASSSIDYFEHMKAAVAASEQASEGERLWILGSEAGGLGKSKERGEYFTKLAAAYPDDPVSHQMLGAHLNAIQQYDAAIAEFQEATKLSPDFAPAYNMLGYAYMAANRDQEAETALRKYIELIPDEPNPHDSLAELLLRMGRFDESIVSYRKALSINPKFIAAYLGIAAALMYQDKHDVAISELQKALDQAENDAQRRQAFYGMAACHTDIGHIPVALELLDDAATLAEKRGDKAVMAQDVNVRGDLLLQDGKVAEAKAEYLKALELARQSSAHDNTKENFELIGSGNLALVAAAEKDFAGARKGAEAMLAGFERIGNANQIRNAHEALGRIALLQKNYREAVSQLTQANLQSPYAAVQLARAYAGQKDKEKARDWYLKAANANTLPDIRYAMVRKAARKAVKT